MARFVLLALSALLFAHQALGHGHLQDPASRNAAWHLGFSTPINYNEDGLNCGGYGASGGKCGECGDPYANPKPRANENGGTYGTGVIVKEYLEGQVFTATMNWSTTHLGFNEFRICPLSSPTEVETQECFDQYLLELADGSGTKYMLEDNIVAAVHSVDLKLPAGLKCERCVLQWYWKAGNNVGQCADGSYQLGCGTQETYSNCADISIS